MRKKIQGENAYASLIQDIKGNIRKTRYLAMRSANLELVLLYYHIGRSLSDRVKSEEWGSKILERISSDIQQEFPGIRGFSVRNLVKTRQFFKGYSFLNGIFPSHASGEEVSQREGGVDVITPPLGAQMDGNQIEGPGPGRIHHDEGAQMISQ